MFRMWLLVAGLVGGLVMAGWISPTVGAPKQTGPNGESCIKTGTERRDGEDQDGNKLNCLWDYCKYCDESGGRINCSIQKTSYSNPRDCHPVAEAPGGMIDPSTMAPRAPAPDTMAPGTGGPATQRPQMLEQGGTFRRR